MGKQGRKGWDYPFRNPTYFLKKSVLTNGFTLHNGANQKEIAAACHIEPGSLTSVLNRMEENGLIERRMLDGNRRTFYIFMTEKGTQLKNIVEKNFVSIEEKAFRNISSEEQAAFMETFSKIYVNLMIKGDTIHE